MNSKAQNKGLFMVLVGGLITITIFSLLYVYLLRGAQDSYGNIEYNESEFSALNQTNSIVNLTNQMNEEFTGLNQTSSGGDIIAVTTTGGYNTIKIVGQTPGIYGSMFLSLSRILGVPLPIAQLLFYFVLLAVISLFILLVFRVYVQ